MIARRVTPLAGFTLVEAVVVIAVIGVIAAGIALFIRAPIESYVDAANRAVLSDAAEIALKRIGRDLQSALPNSVRITNVGTVFYLEYLPVRTGGRYRSEAPNPVIPATSADTCPDTNGNALADEDVMSFGVADTCFRSLGNVPNLASIVPGSDFLVIYNLGYFPPGPGFTNGNAYASGAVTGGNKSLITAAAASVGSENRIAFQPNTFLLDSPGKRFHVISAPVSYVCDPTLGTLRRYSTYPIAAAQLTPPGGASALIAQNVVACTITYDQNVINQRVGLVSIWLSLADPGGAGAVSLFQQVQVSNVP